MTEEGRAEEREQNRGREGLLPNKLASLLPHLSLGALERVPVMYHPSSPVHSLREAAVMCEWQRRR